jgi:hypothetical protein
MTKLAAALLATAAAILPASAETLWIGNGFVTAVTAACTGTIAVGDFGRVVYRPAGTTLGNGADSHLAYVTSRASYTMRVPNNSFRPMINYGGLAVSSKATFPSASGGILQFTATPIPGGGSPELRLVGSFANFFAITGCTTTIDAMVTRAP